MKPIIVMQTDFGVGGGSAMHGTCLKVDPKLEIYEANHSIEKFNVQAASRSLHNITPYWPEGTIFVSVIDPGVGTSRRACVALLNNGSYVVSPDNGSLTLLLDSPGIKAVREIDETVNRLKGTEKVSIFHGRDLFAYCAAKLAAGIIDFEGVGPELPVDSLAELPIVEPILEDNAVYGTIDVLDVRFGSLWTNIPRSLFMETGIHYGDRVSITIENDTRCVYRNIIQYAKSFADVYVGEALVYVNSLDCMAVAINQGSFARAYNIGTGNSWRIRIAPFKGFN